jgi:phospholipid transport system substrate-binding protein
VSTRRVSSKLREAPLCTRAGREPREGKPNMRRVHSLMFFLLLGALFSPSWNLRAGEATDAVKSAVDQVLTILRSPDVAPGKVGPETRAKLKSIASSRFDFEEMAKRSLGPNWSRQSPQDQKLFVTSFADLLVNSYADTLASYRGEKIRYLDESHEDGLARVKTAISNAKNEQYNVDYRLHRTADGWKVYDVVIEDVSLVNNFRSQFTRALNKNNTSFAELLQTMRDRGVNAPGT